MKLGNNFRFAVLCVAVCSFGCSSPTSPERQPHVHGPDCLHSVLPVENSSNITQAIAPQPGIPINPSGAFVYFREETARLIQQGSLGTNLLQGISFRDCHITLPSAVQQTLTPRELAKAAEMGVAIVGQIVRVEDGPPQLLPLTATGFFLTESGVLATCRHVLNAPYVIGLAVMTRDGRVALVREALAVDTSNDLIIVQVDGDGFTPIPVSATAAAQGEFVWVLSHPQWHYYTLTSGIVSGYFAVGKRQVVQMTVTADFAVGSSGAPVLNDRGEVVGIAKMTANFNADQSASKSGNLQMVSKVCTPSPALLELIQKN